MIAQQSHRVLRLAARLLSAARLFFAASVLTAATFSFCPAAEAQTESGATGPLPTTRPTVKTKPVPLDWRSILWPTLDYTRTPIVGGAALYAISDQSAKKFRIDVLFEGGVYSTPREKRPSLGAAVDLLLQGGIGQMSFEKLQKVLTENGIQMSTRLTRTGYFQVSVEALSSDFPLALKLLEDLLLRPKFEDEALTLWKQERIDDFEALLDASNSRKQNAFIEQEAMTLAFGDDHYFATSLQRASKKSISAVKLEDVKSLAKKLINRASMNVLLSGTFSSQNHLALEKVLGALPRQLPPTFSWLPDRPKQAPSSVIKVTLIRKPDMSQAAVSLRYIFPKSGRLNRLEKTRFAILREVFSSSAGVVGNDRFSKAMRADSGISYSPHSNYDPEGLEPNTSVGIWRHSYQSPNERIVESVNIARKTWEEFATKGITEEELENARISKMNMTLAQENTIFDKADDFIEDLLAKSPVSPISTELSLARLDLERSAPEVNATLNRLIGSESIPVMVIMGNPSDTELKELKALPNIEVVTVVPFTELVKELQ